MKSKEKIRPEEVNDPIPYTFSDQVTRKKIKKHLEDIHDVITEDDIKNVKIPGEEMSSGSAKVKGKSKEDSSPGKEKEDIETDHDKPVTPWDILRETGSTGI